MSLFSPIVNESKNPVSADIGGAFIVRDLMGKKYGNSPMWLYDLLTKTPKNGSKPIVNPESRMGQMLFTWCSNAENVFLGVAVFDLSELRYGSKYDLRAREDIRMLQNCILRNAGFYLQPFEGRLRILIPAQLATKQQRGVKATLTRMKNLQSDSDALEMNGARAQKVLTVEGRIVEGGTQ